MGNVATSWKATELWKDLERCTDQGAEAVRAALSAEPCMNTIEAWLKHAGSTGTEDFTLHDAEHSFRVAQRMAEVVPAHVRPKLSSYELALLLMSAYLHDIGMSPRRGLVKELWNYLAHSPGPAEAINTLPAGMRNELPEFRRYLDDNGVEPGLLSQRADASTRGTVDELVAYYCRRRHNDWSKAWIDEHLQGQRLGEFHSWLEDLTDLCLSHHHGKDRLLSERFDPRLVANTGEMVNLRYLACVLRVSDILENDPKRTPEIVFQQRDIQPSSRIYWFKDHEFRCKIEPSESGDTRKLIVSARPKRAAMERACRETMDAIAAELKLCRAIHEEKPFSHARGLRCEQYQWDLLDLVTDDIRNANNTYVYIDGAFRPDTKRILQLLSGNELYGDPLAAIRELLQNAFDAIREIVAHERLSFWDNLRPDQQKVYDWSSHDDAPRTVTLRLEREPQPDGTQAYWLTCMDEGIGMSRSILERHLLVSGATPRADLRDLERRCEAAGFSLGRTGQFGIGVLSYFMLAHRVEIKTRRNPHAGGDDGTGWYFETEGVGAFGELRKAPDVRPGTKVRLLLREPQLSPNVTEWAQKLSRYIRETLVRIPCRFRFDGTSVGGEEFTFEPGWTPTPVDRFDLLVSKEAPDGGLAMTREFESFEARKAREAQTHAWEQIREEIRRTIRWEEVSGELPEHLGYYRVHFAYFELPGGPSLAFLRLSERGDRLLCQWFMQGACYIGGRHARVVWKGISTRNAKIEKEWTRREVDKYMAVIDIDLTNPKAGAISVNRNKLDPSNILLPHVSKIREAVGSALQNLASRIAEGKHLLISQSCVPLDLGVRSPNLYWMWQSGQDDVTEIVHVTEPLLTISNELFSSLSPQTSAWWVWDSSVKVMQLSAIPPYGSLINSILPSEHLLIATQVVRHVSVTPPDEHVCMLFSVAKPGMHTNWGGTCRFPPLWRGAIAAMTKYNGVLLNTDNPAVAVADSDKLKRFLRLPLITLRDIASTPDQRGVSERGAAAAWLIACAIKSVDSPNFWRALQELSNGILQNVWHLVLRDTGDEHISILLVSLYSSNNAVVRLSPTGYETQTNLESARHIIPDPGPEWTVRALPDEGAPLSGSAKPTRPKASSASKKTSPRSTRPKKRGTKRRH